MVVALYRIICLVLLVWTLKLYSCNCINAPWLMVLGFYKKDYLQFCKSVSFLLNIFSGLLESWDTVNRFYNTSLVAVLTPTYRHTSVRHRCVIEVFGGVFVLSRCSYIFLFLLQGTSRTTLDTGMHHSSVLVHYSLLLLSYSLWRTDVPNRKNMWTNMSKQMLIKKLKRH